MALLFVILFIVELVGFVSNPYAGLLLFAAVPVALVIGLVLTWIGVRLESRRRREPGAGPSDWPVLDLRVPRQRQMVVAILALVAINLIVLSMASYGAVHYMETTEFCGQVCHTTMEPQFVAHRSGPHARVACVACHVGPGMGALVESKLAGTRQLWQVATGSVPTPVPSPVHSLRPARYTCEQCHWPEKFHGDRIHVFTEFADDEESTAVSSELTLFVGGGSAELGVGSGIHWHMNLDNEIEYITIDPQREVIPWVQLRDREGNVREYVAPGTTPEMLASGERRRMDCMDCHNRPAHTFFATPERAVDAALVQGLIPRDLPFARREAVAAVSAEYPDARTALDAIATRLREHYQTDPAVDARLVERAIAGAQAVWSTNVFPAMNVSWGTYPNHIGHIDFPGCFRCHDDEHEARDGSVIRQDCELCHTER
jgi:hypothetical protein